MNTYSTPDEAETAEWLPKSKLTPMHVDDNHLLRHRQLTILNNAVRSYRLTVLSAPCGYGKSTLLYQWLQINSAGTLNDEEMPAAYLSLDSSENNRTHFLLALIAALQTLHPECGQRAMYFLRQHGVSEFGDSETETEILTGLIVIDIGQFLPNPFVLILDDYERITNTNVHNALDYLLRRLPPQAHVVISTTQDPPLSLATMRAYGLATLLRAADLAFDEAESTAFLVKVSGLNIPPTQQNILYRYTEGWPTGLLLLSQELRLLSNETARRQLVLSLEDVSSRTSIWPTLESYLCKEMFDDLPPSLKLFLMQTSILEHLHPEPCQALTGRQDAGQLLVELYHRNFFLFLVTAQPDVKTNGYDHLPLYRYHTIFGAFLRSRLQREIPSELSRLHRTAAEVESDPLQKVRHYLAVQCWAEAAQILESMNHAVDWPGDLLAKLARNAGQMPVHIRQLLLENRKSTLQVASHLRFTAREIEVLSLLSKGASNRAIAEELTITVPTVKGHISKIMHKLEARTRQEAVLRAIEIGLLHPQKPYL